MSTTIDAFKTAMLAAGLTPPDEIIGDGGIHRFSTNNKGHDTAGWYILHLDKLPAGSFGNWREGRTETWCSIDRKVQTPAQQSEYATLLKSMQNARHRAKKAENDKAAETAAAIWAAAATMDDSAAHGYLVKKGIRPNGAKLIDSYAARQLCPFGNLSNTLAGPLLVIPMRNAANQLRSLQFISTAESDNKRPLTGGEKQGCFHLIDKPDATATKTILIVGEGFATAASIHEATGKPVVMAIDSGNLEAVCKALRKAYPDAALIVAADDDWRTEGNPGRKSAKAAALAVGGVVVSPLFPADRPDKATDFNDMAALSGLEAVKACFAGVIEKMVNGVIDVSDTLVNAPAIEPDSKPTAADFTADAPPSNESLFPDMDGRPCYKVLDDWAEDDGRKYKSGVYYCGIKAGKGDAPPVMFDQWICSPLHIDAVTFDGQNNNFGRLLRFKPTVGKWREWAMPMELLAGDGSAMRGELLAMGVELDPYGARQQLPAYLQSEHPKRKIHCALSIGWCGDSFVLPDTVIGPKAADVIFQSGERGHDEHTTAGTLAGWQTEIAARAVGNPLLLLAVSASFAGPMLARCNAEGGGIHYVGDSATGKSTAMEAACSTWGGPNFKRSWRSTANGMEGAAALFNDCLLALDEISECDPKEVGAIVYALGNGRGKQRASRSGMARGVTRWRCFVMSNGERTIATAMQEGGHRAKAGQAIRLLDIPAAQTYGAWDNLHGAHSGAAFSDALKRAAVKNHGHAGRAFLEKLTHDTRDFCAMLEEFKGLPLFTVDGIEGQDKRAAARFALIGLSGELATEYGLTGWPEGAAMDAAAYSFKLWRSQRGQGNDERRQILRQVSGFIERHGDGRFSDAGSTNDMQIRDRAGWWRDDGDTRQYLFTADGMREALKGFDFKRALDVLQEAQALPAPGANGERTRFTRIAGRGVKLYLINTENLTGGEHGS